MYSKVKMSNQSGRILLVLLLFVLFLIVSLFFYPQIFRKNDKVSFPVNDEAVNRFEIKSSESVIKDFAEIGIKFDFPRGTQVEKFPNPQEFGMLGGVVAESVIKVYFNLDSNLTEDEKMSSGLTLFFIKYPNKIKYKLEEFLPVIKDDEKNKTDELVKIRVGQFDGYKHVQCCYSGGVTEYYFFNPFSDLILIKVYNYGPDHELYADKLENIINSITSSD